MRDFLDRHDYGTWDDMMQALEWYAKDEAGGDLCIGVDISGDREEPSGVLAACRDDHRGASTRTGLSFFSCAC